MVEITATGTVSLQTALPTSTRPIALRGPGADKLTIERGVATQFQLLRINGNGSLIEGLTLKDGDAGSGSGGGIFLGGTSSLVRGCVVTGNKAADGAGIFLGGSNSVIADCEITGNTASNDGGGVGAFANGTIYNSTISGNTATNGGGGIYLNAGMSSVLHCTLSGNTALNGGGMFLGAVTVMSTVAADNTATGTGPDLNTTTAAVSFSLVKDAAGSNVVDGTNDNKVADPQLGALASNGGPTKTMAISTSSPATNAGTSVSLATGGLLLGPQCFDQRGVGFPRWYGAAPDMGAYELKSGATITPTSLADSGAGSLREALTNANATTGFTLIDLSGLSGTISLATALPQITEGVHFKGPGADKLTVERGGAANFSVFDINPSRGFVVQFTGLTITKGAAGTLAGGGILSRDPAVGEPCVIVDACAITANSAARGGGIGLDNGILLVRNSEISGNSATGTGGGIDVTQPAGKEQSVLLMENSTVSGNTSGGDGGGIALTDRFNRLRFVTVANNTATGAGGGLKTSAANNTIEIYSSICADNMSGSGGADWHALGRQNHGRNNLVESANATVNLTNGTNGNVVGLDPGLGALELNSATTKTHAITAMSEASEKALLFPQVTKDQRNFTRPTDKQDMGAFEVGGTAPPVTTTTTSGGTAGGGRLSGPGRNEGYVIKGDSDCSLTSPAEAPTQGLWIFALLTLLCWGLRRQS